MSNLTASGEVPVCAIFSLTQFGQSYIASMLGEKARDERVNGFSWSRAHSECSSFDHIIIINPCRDPEKNWF